jgi:hypothetical protein
MTELELAKESARQYLELIKFLEDRLVTALEKNRQYEKFILSNISAKS